MLNEFVLKAVENNKSRFTAGSNDDHFSLLEDLGAMNEQNVEEAQLASRKQETPYTLDQDTLVVEAFKDMYEMKDIESADDKDKEYRKPVVGYVWVRLPGKSRWERLYIRVNASSISFCMDIAQQNFAIKYILINCEINIIQMPIPQREVYECKTKSGKQYNTFVIKHPYDSDNLLVSFEEAKDTPPLSQLYRQLVMKSLDRTPDYAGELACVDELNDTNKFSFGKILVRILQIENLFATSTIFIRIRTGPYVLETRHFSFDKVRYQVKRKDMISKGENPDALFNYKIMQDFYMPITNKYGHVTIELITKMWRGLLNGKIIEKVIFTETLSLMKLQAAGKPLNKTAGFKLTSKQLDSIADGISH